jgi:predicted dinucleotide-binding enzyme
MQAKGKIMKVAIIGAGNMGRGLAGLAVAQGHDVWIGARQADQSAVAGAKVTGVAEAAQGADLVVLATPYAAAVELAGIHGFAGQVVLDISNPITPDFLGLVVGHSSSAAEEIQKAAPKARVVKGFNTLFAGLLPAEARQNRLQTFVAGDDAAAKSLVLDFARAAGFDARDAGPLSNSRFLEPLGEMNIQFGYILGQGPGIAPVWIAA